MSVPKISEFGIYAKPESGPTQVASVNIIDQPRIFLGIPSGPSKLYSTYYMVAALANLDYQNLDIHWTLTGGVDSPAFEDFHDRVTQLMSAVKWPSTVTWHVHYNLIPMQSRVGYGMVLENTRLLRNLFLDSDCEYFMDCGGDNPPPRAAIKRLMQVDADVAFAIVYQHPAKDKTTDVIYPLAWRFLWDLADVDKLKLEPLNREALRKLWLSCPNVVNIAANPNWTDEKVVWNVAGGNGCCLIKRRVLEMVDWSIVPEHVFHSEDLHFMTQALYYGFTTAVLTDLHCGHMDEAGNVW